MLAHAWRDPTAYDGITRAGPVEMPAEIAVLVALDDAPALDRLAGATGRDPAWRP
ncbi:MULTISPECIES: hypothetical protein [unclassified Nocardioides]|uniref:hypothetical protein n=1 Tax=unclassified Nocardioides TaxID=2615069 RepID=UPI0009F0746C|nr:MULTISPECIES: hypothetical protein [unclassified Nocardioides]GAW50358.1 uncharacterized protein PD653B2_2693 [Nocardioides sp. PD653-B2]GAW53080.1 uncharacterized protein PD653_0478 [Nocardioides sp. PD653]